MNFESIYLPLKFSKSNDEHGILISYHHFFLSFSPKMLFPNHHSPFSVNKNKTKKKSLMLNLLEHSF